MHTFFLMENAIPCDKDVNKNYLKHTRCFHLYRHKTKLMWLGDELGRWISKRFDIHRPNHRRRRTFISSHQIYNRRRRWVMELIAAVGTKLYMIQNFGLFSFTLKTGTFSGLFFLTRSLFYLYDFVMKV